MMLALIASTGICSYAQPPLQLDPAKEINISRSRLIQLTRGLGSADISQQYEFVQIALIEMYQTYQSEIKNSRNTRPATLKKRRKLLHWRSAAQTFINQLDKYFLLLDSNVNVSLSVNRQKKVLLIIAGHPVIVNGPNPASHQQMEQQIVRQFCQVYDCSHYLDDHAMSSELTKASSYNGFNTASGVNNSVNSSGSWLFRSEYQAIYQTGRGIDCEFKDSTEREKKATACQRLANEINRLSEALRDARNAGNKIEGEYLSIKPQADIDMVQIMINKQGFYIKLASPLLHKNAEWFSVIRPWLQDSSLHENAAGIQENIMITGADRLLN